MEGNASTPHLLTDVRFSVSRKGYDPDEVDNFLERVSGAVAQLQDKLRQSAAQAEEAASRATKAQSELKARVTTLESELAAGGGGGSGVEALTPEDEAARASTLLVMAQRTAESTTKEASAAAALAISAAEAKASTLVSEAEQKSAALLAASQAEADELVNRRREALAEEIRGLESVRDAVAADVAAMEKHVAEQRGVLQASITRVQAVLDDPSSFHLAPAPALSGVTISAAEDAVSSDEDEAGALPDSPPIAASPRPDLISAAEGDGPTAPDGPPTMAHPAPQGPDESPLGPPDEEADAAMKAFFEAEFDDDPGRSPR